MADRVILQLDNTCNAMLLCALSLLLLNIAIVKSFQCNAFSCYIIIYYYIAIAQYLQCNTMSHNAIVLDPVILGLHNASMAEHGDIANCKWYFSHEFRNMNSRK